jgi:hypothetical protein
MKATRSSIDASGSVTTLEPSLASRMIQHGWMASSKLCLRSASSTKIAF